MNWTTLTTGWDLMRVLRLTMGLLAAVQAIELRDPLIGLISVFFLYQAMANVSCCGVGDACTTSVKPKAKQNVVERTSYEEVK
jgi:hypothetical protein